MGERQKIIVRQFGRYDFEDGGYLQILIGGDVETEAAISMIETLIGLKRNELSSLDGDGR